MIRIILTISLLFISVPFIGNTQTVDVTTLSEQDKIYHRIGWCKALDNNEGSWLSPNKIDDFYATIGRQSFFTLFEIEAHNQIANSITVDDISDIYRKNLKEQFGNSINISEDFGIEWSCIPHFYHSPFYCYSYSFGNLLAVSLFQIYKNEGDDFVSTYTGILSAGGSQKPEKLLKEHGLDISKSKFWQSGFDYIKKQVDELAKL